MENATKALLIAAGMLFAIMILSLLVMGYGQISSYYEQKHQIVTAEQLDKFNKQFQNYNRGNIRGNELISLMNKVIDYNESQSYQVGTEYKPIKVKIVIGLAFVDEFKYKTNDGQKHGEQNDRIKETIQNTVDNVNNKANDEVLVAITKTPDDLKEVASDVGINNLTDTQLQKLTMEISNILIDEEKTDNSSCEARRLREILLRNILKLDIGTEYVNDIRLNSDTYKTENGRRKN